MTKLKVRGLKWKTLKVRKSVLYFCQKKKRVYFLKKINLNRFQIELNGGKKKILTFSHLD